MSDTTKGGLGMAAFTIQNDGQAPFQITVCRRPRSALAQWRHKHMGPPFYRLGRKIIYRGADLNPWAEAQRVDPCESGG